MKSITSFRALALGVALGFIVAVAPSCGKQPTITKCNHTTCTGCCDDTGSCFTGGSPDACGADGITCVACKTGQTCTLGVCRIGSAGGGGGTDGGGTGGGSGGGTGGGTGGGSGGGGGGGAPACGVSNCPSGCCDPVTGSCHAGIDPTACGGGGQLCHVCNSGAGQTCQSGLCTGGNCDSTTCPNGCCSGTVCVTPQTTAQCGLFGASCVTCQGAATCDADAGVCIGGGTGGGAGGAGGGGGLPGLDGGLPGICTTAASCPGAGDCCDAIIPGIAGLCVTAGDACSFMTGTCTAGTCQ